MSTDGPPTSAGPSALRTIGLVLLGVLVGLLISSLIWLSASPPRGVAISLLPRPSPLPFVVDVRGEVLRPGVYSLPPGSRVQDAVKAAGGLTLKADESQVNLAATVADGQQILVPAKAPLRTIGDATLGIGATQPAGELININTADLATLETLPGIGPALAQRIIDYREANGPFNTIDDIVNVDGIGPTIFGNIQTLITVGQ